MSRLALFLVLVVCLLASSDALSSARHQIRRSQAQAQGVTPEQKQTAEVLGELFARAYAFGHKVFGFHLTEAALMAKLREEPTSLKHFNDKNHEIIHNSPVLAHASFAKPNHPAINAYDMIFGNAAEYESVIASLHAHVFHVPTELTDLEMQLQRSVQLIFVILNHRTVPLVRTHITHIDQIKPLFKADEWVKYVTRTHDVYDLTPLFFEHMEKALHDYHDLTKKLEIEHEHDKKAKHDHA